MHLLGDIYASPEEEADVSCNVKHRLPSFQLSHRSVAACAPIALIPLTRQRKGRHLDECSNVVHVHTTKQGTPFN